MKSNYHFGIDEEKKLARKLKKAGAESVKISAGSRGGYDILADFGKGKRKLAIQLKATCKEEGRAKSVTPKETKRLIKESKAVGATPVVGKKEKGKFTLTYAIAKRKVAI
jgi:Holliday junction resolvase